MRWTERVTKLRSRLDEQIVSEDPAQRLENERMRRAIHFGVTCLQPIILDLAERFSDTPVHFRFDEFADHLQLEAMIRGIPIRTRVFAVSGNQCRVAVLDYGRSDGVHLEFYWDRWNEDDQARYAAAMVSVLDAAFTDVGAI